MRTFLQTHLRGGCPLRPRPGAPGTQGGRTARRGARGGRWSRVPYPRGPSLQQTGEECKCLPGCGPAPPHLSRCPAPRGDQEASPGPHPGPRTQSPYPINSLLNAPFTHLHPDAPNSPPSQAPVPSFHAQHANTRRRFRGAVATKYRGLGQSLSTWPDDPGLTLSS